MALATNPPITVAHGTNGARHAGHAGANGAAEPPALDPGQVFERGVELSLKRIDEQRAQLERERTGLATRISALQRESKALASALAAYRRATGTAPPAAARSKPASAETPVRTITRHKAEGGPTIKERIRTYGGEHAGIIIPGALYEELVEASVYPDVRSAQASVSTIAKKMVAEGELVRVSATEWRLPERGGR